MAESMQQKVNDRELPEKNAALPRAATKPFVAALGQFALTNSDLAALLHQACLLRADAGGLSIAPCIELSPAASCCCRLAPAGNAQRSARPRVYADGRSQAGYTLAIRRTLVVDDLRTERRLPRPRCYDHGVVSGISVASSTPGPGRSACSARPHGPSCAEFTGTKCSFLSAAATAVAWHVARNRTDAELQKLAAFAQLKPQPALEFAGRPCRRPWGGRRVETALRPR